MRNPNVRIVLILLVLVAAIAAAGLVMTRGTVIPAPQTTGSGVSITPEIPKPDKEPMAYLRVQVDAEVLPLIPLAEGGEYTVTQPTGETNIIHTTAQGAVMHFSTCKNQSCIQQGEVSLDNRDMRVLGSMIVCLPNKVVVELLTPDEIQLEGTK